jgi:hypothetical protein
MTRSIGYVDRDEATALASDLAEAASRRGGPVKHDDGTVHAPHLVRAGDRLYQNGEPWAWYDLSADGAPRTDYNDAEAPDDLNVDEAHRVRHQDGPMQIYHGWVEASNGWLLVSTDGSSWTPEAYVESDEGESR